MVNVGFLDRAARFILGSVLLVTPFMPQLAGFFPPWGNWAYVCALAGAILLGTAIFGLCPAYALFGIRTCALASSSKSGA